MVVYIVRCADGSLYTGSTTDIVGRLHAHNKLKTGAKYTRSRRPVMLVYSEVVESLASARRREAAIKKMTREEKLALIHASKPTNPLIS